MSNWPSNKWHLVMTRRVARAFAHRFHFRPVVFVGKEINRERRILCIDGPSVWWAYRYDAMRDELRTDWDWVRGANNDF